MSPETHSVLSLIGTWLAGVGTIFVAVVALVLAWRDRRVRLLVSINSKHIIPPPVGRRADDLYVGIQVTNVGLRPVQITGIGWSFGIWPLKTHLHQIPGPRNISAQVPLSLNESESGSFMIPFSQAGGEDWLGSMADVLRHAWFSHINVATLRLLVWTSYGRAIRKRPGRRLRKHLIEAARVRPVN